MTKVIITVSICATLIILAAIVPIKTYKRGGCFVYGNQRLDLIKGENIEKVIDANQRNYVPSPYVGACDPTLRKVKLYLL